MQRADPRNVLIYVPDSHLYAEKLVTEAPLNTLHGGVSLPMAKVREQYWIPRLRRLTRRVLKACNGCRRFRVTAFTSLPTGQLPKDRTEGRTPFQVVGVDFARPLKYRGKKVKKESLPSPTRL